MSELEGISQRAANLTPGMPALGIDLDGTIDEFPVFFRLLSKTWPGKVYIITFRSDRQKAIADIAKHGVRYDELILVNSFAQKANIISEHGILIYFDDQPEALKGIPESVNVVLVRNGGNFDFDQQKWIMSEETARLLLAS